MNALNPVFVKNVSFNINDVEKKLRSFGILSMPRPQKEMLQEVWGRLVFCETTKFQIAEKIDEGKFGKKDQFKKI